MLILGCVALVGASVAITRRTVLAACVSALIAAVSLSGCMMLLSASFLAVALVSLMAGALLALFVFGVVVLNRDDTEPIAPFGLPGRLLALASGASLLWWVARLGVARGAWTPGTTTEAQTRDFGTTLALGRALYGPLLVASEMLALLSLIVVVGTLALARVTARNPKGF